MDKKKGVEGGGGTIFLMAVWTTTCPQTTSFIAEWTLYFPDIFPSLSALCVFSPLFLLGKTSLLISLASNYDLIALVGYNNQKKQKKKLKNISWCAPQRDRLCISHHGRKVYLSGVVSQMIIDVSYNSLPENVVCNINLFLRLSEDVNTLGKVNVSPFLDLVLLVHSNYSG